MSIFTCKDPDLNRWVAETLVKQYGLCQSIQDLGILSAEEIYKELKARDNKFVEDAENALKDCETKMELTEEAVKEGYSKYLKSQETYLANLTEEQMNLETNKIKAKEICDKFAQSHNELAIQLSMDIQNYFNKAEEALKDKIYQANQSLNISYEKYKKSQEDYVKWINESKEQQREEKQRNLEIAKTMRKPSQIYAEILDILDLQEAHKE